MKSSIFFFTFSTCIEPFSLQIQASLQLNLYYPFWYSLWSFDVQICGASEFLLMFYVMLTSIYALWLAVLSRLHRNAWNCCLDATKQDFSHKYALALHSCFYKQWYSTSKVLNCINWWGFKFMLSYELFTLKQDTLSDIAISIKKYEATTHFEKQYFINTIRTLEMS